MFISNNNTYQNTDLQISQDAALSRCHNEYLLTCPGRLGEGLTPSSNRVEGGQLCLMPGHAHVPRPPGQGPEPS